MRSLNVTLNTVSDFVLCDIYAVILWSKKLVVCRRIRPY